MSYRQYHSAYKAKDGSVGDRNIDDLLDAIDYKNLRRKEEKRLGAEKNQRINLNLGIVKSIEKKMQQDWPEDMLVESIQREFTDENPDRVELLVNHWLKKYNEAEELVRKVLARTESGEISKEEADKIITRFGNRSYKIKDDGNTNFFSIFVKSCYQSKKSKLKEER